MTSNSNKIQQQYVDLLLDDDASSSLLLNELTENQLKQLAEHKGIDFTLNSVQKNYYQSWDEKDMLVDMMTDYKQLTISEIEKFIADRKV